MPGNLYVHFPFCRSRCSYCTLYSRSGSTVSDREKYIRSLLDEFARRELNSLDGVSTVYFGGGSPALCDLRPVFSHLHCDSGAVDPSGLEFTVELHPSDVTEAKLRELRAGGVNRVSMGVQSFDDRTLSDMGRGYTAAEAVEAFRMVGRYFDNIGIDLIVGYPGDSGERVRDRYLESFVELGLRHCSVYSLQNERGLVGVPDDDAVLDSLQKFTEKLSALGFARYEISNYSLPGYECRHNLAVWRGEDYLGVGEGACGRVGLTRTRGVRTSGGIGCTVEDVTRRFDLKERTLFRLRTREGIDCSEFPEWRSTLDRFAARGLLSTTAAFGNPDALSVSGKSVFFLTSRGAEVCDSILAELV